MGNAKTCSVDGCDISQFAKGYCNKHYQRYRKNGDPTIDRRTKFVGCIVDGCDSSHYGGGLCQAHYQRRWRTGDPLGNKRKQRGTCSIESCKNPHYGKGLCQLHYQRRVRGAELKAPKRTWPKAKTWDEVRWTLSTSGYVVGTFKGKQYLQHRIVWEQHHGRALHPFENIHHINGIRHDNRIENLELWTKAQPCGQRPEDLVAWVVENYPDMIAQQMKGKTNDQPARPRRPRSGDSNNQRPTSRPNASRRTSSRTVRSR